MAAPPSEVPAAGRAARPAPAAPSLPVFRLEVGPAPGRLDPAGAEARAALIEAGLGDAGAVRVLRVFFLQGALGPAEVERAAREVLADPVQEVYAARRDLLAGEVGAEAPWVAVSVKRRPGVTNPEAESARLTLGALGLPVERVQTARTYLVPTRSAPSEVLRAARRALGNEVIEEVLDGRVRTARFPAPARAKALRRVVPLRGLDAKGLLALSFRLGLALSREEMLAIQAHFRARRREPTDVELETLAQTWSEHCKHKTLAGAVRMRDEAGERAYQNLLKETIFEATRRLVRPWCWSVFEDNAGVVDFDGEDGVCMKVETHNHPSAIEPYGGAGTGVGGVIRDILGTGKGARPVANTDVFCFGPPDLPADQVPEGALHPRRLLKGVVAGVRDYGNRMGIPTVNGALCFDPRYLGNPVVYCGCVGLLPRRFVKKAARPGDLIVAFGGRTGRDGIHGATFSSLELHAESETVSSGAVQIGDPITEKKVLDVLLAARDRGLFHAVTDCGAGGFSSAVGEMGAATGAEVDLAAAPLKYEGLEPFEIWISEAQERMVAAIAPGRYPRFEALCRAEDVECVVLGRFTADRRLVVRHGRTRLADLPMDFLHDGLPRVTREATFRRGGAPEPDLGADDPAGDLLALLAMPQIGSKEWVIRQYDHEVQAGAVVRALVGPGHGPADAAVLAPKLGSRRGVVLGNGINPAYGDIDPYAMALAVADEALRNVVCVGADPARVALLDNFTWGNCNRPETLGALVRAAEGCRDAALLFGTPFISGKDSLNNEFRTADGERISVPPTLLISALGVIADVRRTVTSDLKEPGAALVLVGETHDELGGSHWLKRHGVLGERVPVVRPSAPRVHKAVAALVRRGLVRAAHDPSEGGLAVALAEMALGAGLGARLDLGRVPATTAEPHRVLFSESATRYLLEVAPARRAAVRRALDRARVPWAVVGEVLAEPVLVVGPAPGAGRAGGEWFRVPVAELAAAWQGALLGAREPR